MRFTKEQKVREIYKHLYNCFFYILTLMELLEEKIAKLESRIEYMERIVCNMIQKPPTQKSVRNIYKEVVEEVKEKIKKRSYSPHRYI